MYGVLFMMVPCSSQSMEVLPSVSQNAISISFLSKGNMQIFFSEELFPCLHCIHCTFVSGSRKRSHILLLVTGLAMKSASSFQSCSPSLLTYDCFSSPPPSYIQYSMVVHIPHILPPTPYKPLPWPYLLRQRERSEMNEIIQPALPLLFILRNVWACRGNL